MAHSAAHEASLRFTSPTDRGGYAIAALSGDLGTASAPALREQLRSLLRAASQLIIDLSAVEHADAGGLAVLVGSGHRARLLGGSLRLAAPSPERSPGPVSHRHRPSTSISFPRSGRRSPASGACPQRSSRRRVLLRFDRPHRCPAIPRASAAQPAMPASDPATARAGQDLISDRAHWALRLTRLDRIANQVTRTPGCSDTDRLPVEDHLARAGRICRACGRTIEPERRPPPDRRSGPGHDLCPPSPPGPRKDHDHRAITGMRTECLTVTHGQSAFSDAGACER